MSARRREWTRDEIEEVRRQHFVERKTYDQIAREYGISRQRIAQLVSTGERYYSVKNHSCFPGLDRWMHENQCTCVKLSYMMELAPSSTNTANVRARIQGKTDLRKSDIDKLIRITGMTYEELFNGAIIPQQDRV